MESGSPPASSLLYQCDEDLTQLSISELISNLRTAFQSDEYNRVEQALILKERKMKMEIEEKTEKAELALLDKMRIEEEMQKQKQQLEKQWKEEKAAKERYETLMKKLEDEKQTLIEHWEMKVGNLTKRVSSLEDETKLLMNGDCTNVGVNTKRASRADNTTRVAKEEKETLSPSRRYGSVDFSSRVIWQFRSKNVLPAPVIAVDSDEDECNSTQGNKAAARIVAENGKGGGSTGAVQQEHGIGMLKRKLDSSNLLYNSGLLETDSSSSSSDSDSDGGFDIGRIPLNVYNHFKRGKIN